VTTVADLYTLQQIDLELDSKRAALADAQSRLDEPEELIASREDVAQRRQTLHEAEHTFKEREFEADELKRKIEPLEKKLYQGTVVSPKELGDLQKDIESLKRRRSELDDRAIEAMDAVEAAQQALRDAELRLQELEEQHQALHRELTERISTLTDEIAALEPRREQQASASDQQWMQLYERIAAGRQRRAVAKVEGGACQGCRITLPTQLIQKARGGQQIVQCSSCERILYVT
jgi:predicted  nucleic acid-binding Zn-ribbon protein